ncbi:hypothetical protein [Gryllotalpicola koreensis]
MRIPGRTFLAACTLALAASLLAACTPSHPVTDPTKTSKPTPTPVFTSDADALAAATDRFKKYESASDRVGQNGWRDTTPVRPFVSDTGYQHEVNSATKYRAQKAHAIGNTVINNTELESHREENGVATVRMYVCEDLSAVDVIDGSGKSLIDPSRADFVAFVTELRGKSSTSLVIQSLDYWSGGGICKQ